jgi:hypothetical protein
MSSMMMQSLALDLADDVHDLGDVRARRRLSMMASGAVEALAVGAGALDAAGVGADDHHRVLAMP